MMQSISHWGQFEMQASEAETAHLLANPKNAERLAASMNLPTSFFVSRQDKPEDPKLHKFY